MNPQVQRIRTLSCPEHEAELKAAEARLAALEAEPEDARWQKPTTDDLPIVCTTEEDWGEVWNDDWCGDDWREADGCEDDWCEDGPQEPWQDDSQDNAQTTALPVEDALSQTWWEEVDALTRSSARETKCRKHSGRDLRGSS